MLVSREVLRASATLARKLNDYAAALRDEDHAHFGFFASLPDVLNTSYAIAEIEYALDTLQADGVALFTRYGSGNTYLGHSDLDPIWKELDKRGATVFVHPTHPANPEPINPYLPLPLVDFPHETTRAAMDMITSRTLKRYPNVKIILSHAGGTLPFLVSRVLSVHEILGACSIVAGRLHSRRGAPGSSRVLLRYHHVLVSPNFFVLSWIWCRMTI